jgi:hypothetical protein
MAKARMNAIISGLSGSLGRDHYARQTRQGKTIISLKPDFSNRQFSEAQLAQQRRMKQAAAYGRVASKENPVYAKLAEGKAKNAYNIALGDWLNPPVIHRMDWQGSCIRVHARDDVQVTKVVIIVLDSQRQPLEQGDAELVNGVWWEYEPANQGQIQVEAWDLAGNVTRREFEDTSRFTPFPGKAA